MINFLDKHKNILGRVSFFIVYFWFGILKILDVSPGEGVVSELFYKLNLDYFINFETFFYGLGVFEMLIGIGFLIGKFKKIILPLFLFHMVTTFLPVFFNPDLAWQKMWVLTLEGQYIVKNFILIFLGIYILRR